ncbi:transposase [Zoogloea sp. G-4-1-14]|uniref:Transposase n=1 Tax=Zoogloea dura TaxID=2728840 RepID=A0A848GCJ7_9RHOO|nr:transposase [Zoogloea dura]
MLEGLDLFGPTLKVAGAGTSAAGRPRLPIRLMVGLLYLKHAFGESDESVVQRWAENPYWQFFCGGEYFETRLPCDPSGLTRFRHALGDAGVEELLAKTVETAVSLKAIASQDLERVIVDSTMQEKAIAFPTDSRLLDVWPGASWC